MPHSRRNFMKAGLLAGSATLAGAHTAAAADPPERKAAPGARLKLALAAYSFRQKLDLKKPDRWTYFDFIEKAAEFGVEGIELVEYFFERPITAEYISKLKHKCHVLGQSIAGTPVGNTFTHPPGAERDKEIEKVKKWIDVSADLGSPAIRVFAGNAPKGAAEEQARKHVVECLENAGEHAAKRGVFLALENHGGVVATADGILEIVKAVKNPWVAVNFDSGNFHTDDPYADMARIAPYAVAVQYKVEIKPKGKPAEPSDPARVIKILKDAKYRGFVALEYEAKEDPLVAVPKHLEELRKLL